METNNYIILQNTDRRYIQRKFLGKTMLCLCVCVCACVCSVAQSCPTLSILWTVACQTPLSMGLSQQEYQNGSPFLPPENLPESGIKPISCGCCFGRLIHYHCATWETPGVLQQGTKFIRQGRAFLKTFQSTLKFTKYLERKKYSIPREQHTEWLRILKSLKRAFKKLRISLTHLR